MITMLRECIGPRAAGHLREHQGQLAGTLARWRAEAGRDRGQGGGPA